MPIVSFALAKTVLVGGLHMIRDCMNGNTETR